MWMYDLAREQAPSLDHLFEIVALTAESGYDALGLYLEHRFAYPSLPWIAGVGAVTPEMIARVRSEFPSVRLIPFVNLLGHFEGAIYTEEGKTYRESLLEGMQACPCNPDFLKLCHTIIEDTVAAFDDEIIHIGGDETWQLGQCPKCKARAESFAEGIDGKARLYGEHFGPLAQKVIDMGRRPGVWGDMFVTHPQALAFIPQSTLIFDWQYFNGIAETAKPFTEAGFQVVGCPAIQTYNATWCHIPESESNVKTVHADVVSGGHYGTCVTTWELALMGAYDSIFPIIRACGQILNGDNDATFIQAFADVSERHETWARLMGAELQSAGGTFAPGKIRSSLKVRLLLNANPFLAWMHHADELCGEVGTRALQVIEEAEAYAATEVEKGICFFARSSIEFVRLAEIARQLYAEGKTEAAIGSIATTRRMFEDLGRVAMRTHKRIGGSLADVERCVVAKEHVERVITRMRRYGDGSLGYRPAFEVLCHPKFMPHDQANWWLINRWANQ